MLEGIDTPLAAGVVQRGFVQGAKSNLRRLSTNTSYEGTPPADYTYIDNHDFINVRSALAAHSRAPPLAGAEGGDLGVRNPTHDLYESVPVAAANLRRPSVVPADGVPSEFYSAQSYGSVITMDGLMGVNQPQQQQAVLPVGAPEYTYIDPVGIDSGVVQQQQHFYPETSTMGSGSNAPFVLPSAPTSPSYTTTPHGRNIAADRGAGQAQHLLQGAVYTDAVNRRPSTDLYADQYAAGASTSASSATYVDTSAQFSPARRGTLMPEQAYDDNGMPVAAVGAVAPDSPAYLAPSTAAAAALLAGAPAQPPMSPTYSMPVGFDVDGRAGRAGADTAAAYAELAAMAGMAAAQGAQGP